MPLYSISDFCPPGTQIKSPHGLTINPDLISAVETVSHDKYNRYVIIHYGHSYTKIEFYGNVDGEPADVYTIQENITEFTWAKSQRYRRRERWKK